MDKSSRRELIKKLVESKQSLKKSVKHKRDRSSAKVDFVAYVEPTESDMIDELIRMDGFPKKK